jgi:hypothetical protein
LSFIEVAIGPITGVDVPYSVFNVIFIGPHKACAVLGICMAITKIAKNKFLRFMKAP